MDKNKRNKIIGLSIGILIVLIVVVSSTYAYWQITKTQETSNDIVAACLDLNLEDKSAAIDLDSAWPISDDEANSLTGYTFTVTNNCNEEVNYIVGLNRVEEENYLQDSSIKLQLDDNSAFKYSDLSDVEYIEPDNTEYTSRVSKQVSLETITGNETNEHTIRIWVSEDSPVTEQSKIFQGQVFITGSQENPASSGDNINADPVQVFSLNNLADNGNIESIFRNSPVKAGSPNISGVHNSGTHSLICYNNSNRATSFKNLIIGKYYVACKVRIDNYTKGYAGVVIDGGGNSNTQVAVVTESTNNEFVTASGIANITDATEVSLIFGTGTDSATSYIDDIVFIPLSAFETEPTQEQLDAYYEEYLNNLETTYAAETILVENNISVFVERMNEKAQDLGMTNTGVTTSDGNGGVNDYSTARDAMKMMIAASENEILTDVWNNTYSGDGANGTHIFFVKNGERIRSVTAKTTITNEPLLTNYKILGGKTGTGGTRCIGVIAEIDGQKVVAVIMGATSEAYRYSSINDLLGIASNKMSDSSFDTSMETVEDAPSAIASVITDDGYEILYEQEADTRQNLASMTKVLNILTSLDYIEEPKNKTVILKYSEYGDSLYPYDELTYEDAFYHMMLPSSNTTARVVARSIGEKIINS